MQVVNLLLNTGQCVPKISGLQTPVHLAAKQGHVNCLRYTKFPLMSLLFSVLIGYWSVTATVLIQTVLMVPHYMKLPSMAKLKQ